jgi:hypothetical protein
MKWSCFLIVILLFTGVAIGQSPTNQPCPANFVCITREAALKALADADRVAALEKELAAKDAAIEGLKTLLADMRVEFARASGENTILKQQQVRDSAMIELLSKMVRPKKIGLNIF